MFLKTQAKRKGVYYWMTHRFKSASATQIEVIEHVRELANDVDKKLVIIEEDFDKMIKAVEFTVYENILDVLMMAKAVSRLVEKYKIHGSFAIEREDGSTTTIARRTMDILNRVTGAATYLPDEYAEMIREVIFDDKTLTRVKFLMYMKTNKPNNHLEDLFFRLGQIQFDLRDEVCKACGWTMNTFFARKRNRVILKKQRALLDPFTEAEAEKIILIVRELLSNVSELCDKWDYELKIAKQRRLNPKHKRI